MKIVSKGTVTDYKIVDFQKNFINRNKIKMNEQDLNNAIIL
jgi:hypothetical protein